MSDDIWAREKAREVTAEIEDDYVDDGITTEQRIEAALLAAKLAGWREGREAAAALVRPYDPTVAATIRSMPDPKPGASDHLADEVTRLNIRIAELEGEIEVLDVGQGLLAVERDRLRAENERLREGLRAALSTLEENASVDNLIWLGPVTLQLQALLADTGEGKTEGGWRDIKSAPKEGGLIDLWHRSQGRITDARWSRVNVFGADASFDWYAPARGRLRRVYSHNITYWRPSPPSAPPSGAAGEEKS